MQTLSIKLSSFILAVFIFASCNNNLGGDPTLEFFTDSKYTSENDSVPPGDSLLIGLKCTWNGEDKLTDIKVYINDILDETIEIPSNDKEGVGFGKKYEKSAADKDSFVFVLNDEGSHTATLSLVLHKDTASSDVKEISGISLGAQDSEENQLFSLAKQLSYALSDVASNEDDQKVIDLVAAYDADNAFYLGSPATDFGGVYDFSGWVETDTTYFVETDYTDEIYGVLNNTKIKDHFDKAADELKITKKANNLAIGDIYLFKTQSKKYGVIKVNSVTSGAGGSISFDLKVQR